MEKGKEKCKNVKYNEKKKKKINIKEEIIFFSISGKWKNFSCINFNN